jgi:hypothetical protein
MVRRSCLDLLARDDVVQSKHPRPDFVHNSPVLELTGLGAYKYLLQEADTFSGHLCFGSSMQQSTSSVVTERILVCYRIQSVRSKEMVVGLAGSLIRRSVFVKSEKRKVRR